MNDDNEPKLNLCAVAMAIGRDQFLVLIREPCRGAWKHTWLGEVGDNGLPALPGQGFWVWNDAGSWISDGGEYPDENSPEWRGAWLRMSAEQAIAWAQGIPPWESSTDDAGLREQARLHEQLSNVHERAEGYYIDMCNALEREGGLLARAIPSPREIEAWPRATGFAFKPDDARDSGACEAVAVVTAACNEHEYAHGQRSRPSEYLRRALLVAEELERDA